MNNNSEQFINRQEELKLLDTYADLSGLVILIGRRRIGKTSLLTKWIKKHKGIYIQAIEGSKELQLQQALDDISLKLTFPSRPNSWLELLRLLSIDGKRKIVCIDEFHYLVKSDPSLPSVLQKWLDHENKSKCLIILSGSSTKLMSEACLDANAPLYGRAKQVIKLRPMEYSCFAEFLGLKKTDPETFELYSLVGGIPKYWEHLQIIQKLRSIKKLSAEKVVDDLYFSPSPFMDGEVGRLLGDEKIEGITPLSVLGAIGRGVSRPSEIASRLGTPQSQLTKVFEQLISGSVLIKHVPFGTSPRNAKNVNYMIADPSILSWHSLASLHGARWRSYTEDIQQNILSTHIGNIYENHIRDSHPGAQRYWNSNCEIDLVFEKDKCLHIAEVKWAKLNEKTSEKLLRELFSKIHYFDPLKKSAEKYKLIYLEIYDKSFLTTSTPLVQQTLSTNDVHRKH